jgi:2-octaprenyl-6-methoxyphenol hydroxylase
VAEETLSEIAVVGAGPAGLAAALALNHVGASVTLIGPPPGREGSGDTRTAALLESSIELLKALKLFDALADQAAPLKAIRIVDASDGLLRAPDIVFSASELGLEAFGYNIANTALIEVLYAEALQRLRAVEQVSVARLEPDGGDGIRVICGNGKVFKVALVVGADGRHSLCRKSAGIGVDERRSDQAAIATSFSHAKPHDFASTELHARAGSMTTVPMPDPHVSSLIWVGGAGEIERLMRLDVGEFKAALQQDLAGVLGSIDTVGARASFPLIGLRANALAGWRTALVGEAAHILPPIGAQGLNLGFRDAAALVDGVAEANARGADPGSEAVLAAYAAARRIDIATRSFGVDLLSRSLLTDFLPLQAARTLLSHGLNRIGPLRRLIMRVGLEPPTELPRLMRPAAGL